MSEGVSRVYCGMELLPLSGSTASGNRLVVSTGGQQARRTYRTCRMYTRPCLRIVGHGIGRGDVGGRETRRISDSNGFFVRAAIYAAGRGGISVSGRSVR